MAEQSLEKAGARVREQSYGGPFSRSAQRVANNLGIISAGTGKIKKYRSEALEILDKYYEGRQYDHLPSWDQSKASDDTYIPVRKRKPLMSYEFSKVLCSRVASKLVGSKNFPVFKVEDDPETDEFFRAVIKSSGIKSRIIEPVRRMLGAGSVFIRFSMVNGYYQVEHYLSKYCYPIFDEAQQLISVRIQYIYPDMEDLDQNGAPKQKWFRMDLGRETDVLYNNPEAKENSEPIFEVVSSVSHNLGFVQGEWFRTAVIKHKPDGPGLYSDILDFIDEMNYNMSQSSQAISYNQDPQTVISGMDEDDIDALIRSSMKAWNLGKEGKAEFLESDLGAVQRATEFRDKVRLGIQDIARVILMDPEKIVGHAQSGKALEILHGPFVELIEELRPEIEERLGLLLQKMGLAALALNSAGLFNGFAIPDDFQPKSFEFTVQWPELFPLTLEDLQKKVSIANSASNAQIISRETAMRWLAKDFGIEDIEAELEKIKAQPVLNPFGGF